MELSANSASETDGASSAEELCICSQDTLKFISESLMNDKQAEVFTKVLDHGSFTYQPLSDNLSTTYQISVDTVVPTDMINSATAAATTSMQCQFPQSLHSPPPQQYTNYSGQVTVDQHHQPHMMTYTDSAAPSVIPRPPTSLSPSPMSVLPSNQRFTGMFNFRFEFGKQPKDTKSTAWTYSAITNKLYAQKDAMCPVKFAINGDGVAHGLYIRALPVYSRPENLQDVVKRCPNHVQAPESANIPHREHFIWCENQAAQYLKDANTGRFAVRMPYDTPPAGTDFVTYLFSFKCLNSCVGGPNRREMSIIFTLENSNQEVLGRQCIDLRICACPGRDRKSDESKLDPNNKNYKGSTTPVPGSISPALQSPAQQDQSTTTEHVSRTDHIIVNKRPRSGDSDTEIFTLKVSGRKNFELLTKIRDSLEMSDMLSHFDRDNYTKQRRLNDHQSVQPSFRAPPAPAPQQMPLQAQPTNRLPSLFNFSSARQFPSFIKQDRADGMHRCGIDMTDSASAPSSSLTSTTSPSQHDLTVAEWLNRLGLAAYVDNFHNAGLKSMSQLRSEQNFTMKDLENMMLTKSTVSKVWNALRGYRLAHNPSLTSESSVLTLNREAAVLPDSQGSTSSTDTVSPPNSQGSVVSLGGRTDSAGSTLFRPGQFSLTRCSIRFSVTKKADTNASPIDSTKKE